MHVRFMGVVVVVVLAMAGCDGGSSTDSSPSTSSTGVATPSPAGSPSSSASPTASATPSPSPSPTATPTPQVDVATEAVELLVETFNQVYGAPEGATEAPDGVAAAIDDATVEDSEARTSLLEQLDIALTEGVQLRGDAAGVSLGEASTSVSGSTTTFQVDACLSLETRNAVEDDLPEPILTSDGTYRTYPVEGVVTDDGVRLSRVYPDDDTVELPTCVPPALESEVLDDWSSFRDAFIAYRKDTSRAAARDEVASWVAEDSLALSQSDAQFILDDTHVLPGVDRARRDEADVSWCQVPTRNPSAEVRDPDGTTRPLTQIAFTSTWSLAQDKWTMTVLSSDDEGSRDDVPQLWERCFEE